MMKNCSILILASALVLSLGARLGSTLKDKAANYVDEGLLLSDEILARTVCTNSNGDQQLHRITSIERLNKFFSNLPSDHELAPCAAKYRQIFHDLLEVISISNEDVCRQEKVDAIAEFHKKYISTQGDEGSAKVDNGHLIPRTLQDFFKHYSLEVSYVCKTSVIYKLFWLTRTYTEDDFSFKFGSDFMGKIGNLLGNLFDSVKHLDEMVSLWDLSKREEKDSSSVRMNFVVQDSRNVLLVQKRCLNKFKPVYSNTILPIIRLADLGYSYTDPEIERLEGGELRRSGAVKEWYKITRFCETILPCKFYENPKLPKNEAIVISEQEATYYTEPTQPDLPGLEVREYDFFSELSSFKGKEVLDKLDTSSSLVKKAAVIRNARIKSLKKKVIYQYRSLRHGFKKLLGRMSFSKKARCKLEDYSNVCKPDAKPEDLASILMKVVSEQELAEYDDDRAPEVTRAKKTRDTIDIVANLLAASLVVVVLVIALSPSGG